MRNPVQGRRFSEMLKKALNGYHNRAIATQEVIEELITLANEMVDVLSCDSQSVRVFQVPIGLFSVIYKGPPPSIINSPRTFLQHSASVAYAAYQLRPRNVRLNHR